MKTTTPDEISDDFWVKAEPLIPAYRRTVEKQYQRAAGGGRKALNSRQILAAILLVLRNRIAWRAVPRSMGSASTFHRYFKIWERAGFFDELSKSELIGYPELKGFPWEALTSPRSDFAPAKPNKTFPGPAGLPKPVQPARSPTISRLASIPDFAPRRGQLVVEERAPSITEARVQDRLLKLHASTEACSFWNATQSLLRHAVPHDSCITYLGYFDHPKTWKAAKILTSANARMPAVWFEERWKLDITAPYIHRNKGIKFFKFSDIIQNTRELQRTEYFNKFFKPFGWHHTACLTFWDESGIFSAIALRRTKQQGDIRPNEIAFLKSLHPQLETVLRRLVPSHKEQAKLQWLLESARDIPEALMFLDWDLDPLCVNQEALAQCALWNFGPEKARTFNARDVYKTPADIADVCLSLKSQWLGLHAGTATNKEQILSTRILHPDDPRRSATIVLVTANRETIYKPGFRIRFDYHHTTTKPLIQPGNHSGLWRLTAAERELVQLASTGHNNAEIAAQLSKSINTVKHQLTSIYSKLGVDSPRKRYLSQFSEDRGGMGIEESSAASRNVCALPS